jgi:tRNA threonylcarbamoyladenosine biosynthesis protein TsaB
MILALDTSSAACTAALFDADGSCMDRRDELIGRGHSERLVPMIGEMLEGREPREILVGVGPGSFTGIRVAIAAAQGLAIGWQARLAGMSSLALIAAGASLDEDAAAAVLGGHGELFVQQFAWRTLEPLSDLRNLAPPEAALVTTTRLVVGTGAAQLVAERGWGEALNGFPSAAKAMRLPLHLRTLAPKPVYARPPDAKASEAA